MARQNRQDKLDKITIHDEDSDGASHFTTMGIHFTDHENTLYHPLKTVMRLYKRKPFTFALASLVASASAAIALCSFLGKRTSLLQK
jgi:hypothetical protein